MIDLHSHILPGIDDGAQSLEVSLEMARIAVADGTEAMACTPHIYPGLYMNDKAGIVRARDALQAALQDHGIPLRLVTGADVHLVPGILQGLRAGTIPTLNDTRYVLLEPSHHSPPPRFEHHVFDLVASGYIPVITHPERLTWLSGHYAAFEAVVRQGAWLQVTASALTGAFGSAPRYWGERLLGDGLVAVLASDCHSSGRRSPVMSEGRAIAEKLLGAEEATNLVVGRPRALLENRPPSEVPPLPAPRAQARPGLWQRLFRR